MHSQLTCCIFEITLPCAYKLISQICVLLVPIYRTKVNFQICQCFLKNKMNLRLPLNREIYLCPFSQLPVEIANRKSNPTKYCLAKIAKLSTHKVMKIKHCFVTYKVLRFKLYEIYVSENRFFLMTQFIRRRF